MHLLQVSPLLFYFSLTIINYDAARFLTFCSLTSMSDGAFDWPTVSTKWVYLPFDSHPVLMYAFFRLCQNCFMGSFETCLNIFNFWLVTVL